MDNIVTEDFDDASFSQVCTEDYTTESFQHRSGQIYDFVPSSSALELTMALVPGPPSTQTPAMESFVSLDVMVPPQIVSLSEELRWTKTNPEHNAHLDFAPGKRFHWHHLWEMYDHKPNTRLSDIRKIIGHCLTPGTDMNFCHDNDEGLARIIQMTVVLDQAGTVPGKEQDEALAVAFDHCIVIEILGLQVAKELWNYMLFRTNSTDLCIADIAYLYLALGCTLDKTGDAAVIKIYRRIERLHGPHLIEIQAAARDLAYIKDINVYSVDNKGKCSRANIGAVIRDYYERPPSQGNFDPQYLQPPIATSFFMRV
ncbi:hypothetical protein F4604DRAFT_1942516 [Suillus subluteus]|nr:hypothetical protein F4604DRAFT_1942516 [Suillus subluteus]